MRNEQTSLTNTQASRVARFSSRLAHNIETGAVVRLEYRKRDGSKSASTGVLVRTLGEESNLSVLIDTLDKGPRTINVGGIVRMFAVATDETTDGPAS